MDWLCAHRGASSAVSACVGFFCAHGRQDVVLDCVSCLQLVQLSGSHSLQPIMQQPLLSPIVSMCTLPCPIQGGWDALAVLFSTSEVAILQYSPACNRFLVLQRVVIPSGPGTPHVSRTLLASPCGTALAVLAWQDRLAMLPVTWDPPPGPSAVQSSCHCTSTGMLPQLGLPVPFAGTPMVVTEAIGDVAGATLQYATCPEVGAPAVPPRVTFWDATFLNQAPGETGVLLAVLMLSQHEEGSTLKVWGWQPTTQEFPRCLADVSLCYGADTVGIPFRLVPVPASCDATGCMVLSSSGLEHVGFKLPMWQKAMVNRQGLNVGRAISELLGVEPSAQGPLVRAAAAWCTGPATTGASAQQHTLLLSTAEGVLGVGIPAGVPTTLPLSVKLGSAAAAVRPAQLLTATACGQLLWLEEDGDLLLLGQQPGRSAPVPVGQGVGRAAMHTTPAAPCAGAAAPGLPACMVLDSGSPAGAAGGISCGAAPPLPPPLPLPPPAAAVDQLVGTWGPVAHQLMEIDDSDSVSPATTLSPEEATAAVGAGALPRAALTRQQADVGVPAALHLVEVGRLPLLGPVMGALVLPDSSRSGSSQLVAATPRGLMRWSPAAPASVLGATPPGLLPALTGLWALPWAPGEATHHLLLLSCATGTRALAAGHSSSSWEDVSQEVCPGLLAEQLLAAGCIASGLVLLATSSALLLCPWELPCGMASPAPVGPAPAAASSYDLLPPAVAAGVGKCANLLEAAFIAAWTGTWYGKPEGSGSAPTAADCDPGVSTAAAEPTTAEPAVAVAVTTPTPGAVSTPAVQAAAGAAGRWLPSQGLSFWHQKCQAGGSSQQAGDSVCAAPPSSDPATMDGCDQALGLAAVAAGHVAVQLVPSQVLVLLQLVDGSSPSSSRRSGGSKACSSTSSGTTSYDTAAEVAEQPRKRGRFEQQLLEVAAAELPGQVSCLALCPGPDSSSAAACHPLLCVGDYSGGVAVLAAGAGSTVLQQLACLALGLPSASVLHLPPPCPPATPLLVPHSFCALHPAAWAPSGGLPLAVGTRGGTLVLLHVPATAPQVSVPPAATAAATAATVTGTIISQIQLGQAALQVELLPNSTAPSAAAAAPAQQLLVVGDAAWRVWVSPACGRLVAQQLELGTDTPWVAAVRPPPVLLGGGVGHMGPCDDPCPVQAASVPADAGQDASSYSSTSTAGGLVVAVVASNGSLQLLSVAGDPRGHQWALLPADHGSRISHMVLHPSSSLIAAATSEQAVPAISSTPARERVVLVDPSSGDTACSWACPAGESLTGLGLWEASPGAFQEHIHRAGGRRRSLPSAGVPGVGRNSSSRGRRFSSGGPATGAGSSDAGAAEGRGSGGDVAGRGASSAPAATDAMLLPQLLRRLQASSSSASPVRTLTAHLTGSPSSRSVAAVPSAVRPLLLVASQQKEDTGDGCHGHLRVLQLLAYSDGGGAPGSSSPGGGGAGHCSSSSSRLAPSWRGWSLQQVGWLRMPHPVHCCAALDEQHIVVATGDVLAVYQLQQDGKLVRAAHVLARAPVVSLAVSPDGFILAGDCLAGVVAYRLVQIAHPEGQPEVSLDAVWVQHKVAAARHVVPLTVPCGAGSSNGNSTSSRRLPAGMVADGQGRLMQLLAIDHLSPQRSMFTAGELQLPGVVSALQVLQCPQEQHQKQQRTAHKAGCGQVVHASTIYGGHHELLPLLPEQAAWLQQLRRAMWDCDAATGLLCSGTGLGQAAAAVAPTLQPSLPSVAAVQPDAAEQPTASGVGSQAVQSRQQAIVHAAALEEFLHLPRVQQAEVVGQLLKRGSQQQQEQKPDHVLNKALSELLTWLEQLRSS